MSNYEYEKQKAEEARHRREVEQAAQATALAAKKTALATELAMLEQSASLRKQEKIAETNSFRNTVLGALPLVEQNKKLSYILDQIATRLSGFENNSFKIDRNKILEIFQIKKAINDSNGNFKNTPEFIRYISISSKISELTKKPGIANSNKEKFLKWHKIKMVVGLPWLFLIVLSIQRKEGGNKFEQNPIVWFAAFVVVLLAYYFGNSQKKKTLDYFDVHDNLSLESSEIRDSLRPIFFKILKEKKEIIDFINLDANLIAASYFDKVYSNEVINEQSFLPPELRPSTEDWLKFFVNKSTTNQIIEFKSKLETIIYESTVLNLEGISTE